MLPTPSSSPGHILACIHTLPPCAYTHLCCCCNLYWGRPAYTCRCKRAARICSALRHTGHALQTKCIFLCCFRRTGSDLSMDSYANDMSSESESEGSVNEARVYTTKANSPKKLLVILITCSFDGAYVPCIYTSARWSYRRWLKFLLLCSLSAKCCYFPLLMLDRLKEH